MLSGPEPEVTQTPNFAHSHFLTSYNVYSAISRTGIQGWWHCLDSYQPAKEQGAPPTFRTFPKIRLSPIPGKDSWLNHLGISLSWLSTNIQILCLLWFAQRNEREFDKLCLFHWSGVHAVTTTSVVYKNNIIPLAYMGLSFWGFPRYPVQYSPTDFRFLFDIRIKASQF